MNASDTVLVGVIKTKRDLAFLREDHWYRIPQTEPPHGILVDYLAFFQSGRVFGEESGGIYYFAQRTGNELVRRKDLLQNSKPHPRDEHVYHKIQLGIIQKKTPPIINKPKPYSFAFIYTTGDRFQQATHIRDLYSKADYFVDRVHHVLRQHGLKVTRLWDAAPRSFNYPMGAQIRIIADKGAIVASTEPNPPETDPEKGEFLYTPPSEKSADVVRTAEEIMEAVMRMGGPKKVDIPIELY